MNRSDYELFGAKITALRGNELPQAKLNPDVVREVRANRHGKTAKQLASELGVHYRTIEKINYGETWKHVKK